MFLFRASSLKGHGCREQSQQAVSALRASILTQIQIHACCIQNGCAAFTVAVINYRHSDGRNGNSSYADFRYGMCAFSLCDYRPISSVRGGLLLASDRKEIKGYINAARPFISFLSAAHCPSPLSDEVERCNNPMRRKPECTH